MPLVGYWTLRAFVKARIWSGYFFSQKPPPLAPEGADPWQEKFLLTAARVFCPCRSYGFVNKPGSQDEKRHHQAFVGRRDSVTNGKTTNTKARESVPHRGKSFPYLCQSHRLVNKPGQQDEDRHHRTLNDTFSLQSNKTTNAKAGGPSSLPRQEACTLPGPQAHG